MRTTRRNVLVVGVCPDEFSRVAPFLERNDFDVDRFPSARGSLELLQRIAFELLIVRCPLPDMEIEPFLAAVRGPGSACRRSAMLLLAEDGRVTDANRYLGRGANRSIPLRDPTTRVQAAVSELLDVAPRKAARVLARLEIKIGGARDMILCESDNMSATGMLIRTDRTYDPGTRVDFEFTLPEDERPIVGIAEIVRQATLERDQVEGIGVRFLSFAGDSQRRFEGYLATL